jgi:hypothetical protein
VPRVILLLVIVFTLVVLVRRAQQQPPHKRRAAYLQIIVGSAVIGVVILTLMGKMHWVGAALTGLLVAARQMLPVLVRLLPALGSLRTSGARSSSKQSEVTSRIIKMTLDHDSGDLSGVILESTFKGWLLSELNRQQLDELTLLSYWLAILNSVSQRMRKTTKRLTEEEKTALLHRVVRRPSRSLDCRMMQPRKTLLRPTEH